MMQKTEVVSSCAIDLHTIEPRKKSSMHIFHDEDKCVFVLLSFSCISISMKLL